MNKTETQMQREQNVIKLVLIVTVFCFTNLIYSQKKITGKYSNLMKNQEHYCYYDFNENGTFEYHLGANLGDNEFGNGHYQINNDSLVLNYDLTELEYKSYHKTKEYFNSKDFVTIKVFVKDFEGKPIPNTNIYCVEDRKGYILGESKFVVFTLNKDNEDYFLKISNLGYEEHKLKLSKLKNYEIEVFLKKSQTVSKILKHQIVKYQIIEIENSYIIIRDAHKNIKFVKQ